MKVSILISTYNGGKEIPLLLNSIQRLALGSHEMEVILRDDNSSDGTMEKVSKNYPWVKLIQSKRNIGFVKSSNIAMSHATGDVLCCVNQDTILDSHFLLEGLAAGSYELKVQATAFAENGIERVEDGLLIVYTYK